jgi:hypothetical protein
MMIKFLAHGTGKGSSAATYLLDSHDHKGEERAGVAVLRGDPAAVRRRGGRARFSASIPECGDLLVGGRGPQ